MQPSLTFGVRLAGAHTNGRRHTVEESGSEYSEEQDKIRLEVTVEVRFNVYYFDLMNLGLR